MWQNVWLEKQNKDGAGAELMPKTYFWSLVASDLYWPTSTLVAWCSKCYKHAGWPMQVASDQRPEVCFGHNSHFVRINFCCNCIYIIFNSSKHFKSVDGIKFQNISSFNNSCLPDADPSPIPNNHLSASGIHCITWHFSFGILWVYYVPLRKQNMH